MAHIIKHKKSDGAGIVPHPLELQPGELAINSTDRKLFTVDTLQNKTVRLDRGGALWDGKDNYYKGDIVTHDDLVYKCIQDATIIPSLTPPNLPLYWQLVVPLTANVTFDPTLDYKEGDIVSVNGNLYIAPVGGIPAHGPIPDPLNPAPWVDATPDEVGGIIWNNTANYKEGDIVSYKSGANIDSNLYIALADNMGSDPTLLISWYEFNTPRHNEGTWTPRAGDEYPSIIGVESGAVWYINGLPDYVAPPGPQGGYDMTTGALALIHVSNNDRFVWYGKGTDGTDIWLHEQAPDMVEERGGLSWSNVTFYKPGDVVSYNGIVYVAPNPAPTIGEHPGDPSWPAISLERGGIMWTVGQAYQIGDSVWDNSSGPAALYACTIAHIATTGNGANGSPQQIAATNWTATINNDPGLF